jgi:hypothetical protein
MNTDAITIENPHNLVATLFGVPEDDLTIDSPDVAIYDSGFVAIPKRWIAWEVNPREGQAKG